MIQAKEIVVETCQKLMTHYAKKHNSEDKEVKIRIDLQKVGAKPVFGIFKNSTILEKCSLKNIIHAGGGKGFSMILGVHIRNIIKDIFIQSLKQLELNDPKQIFLLLYLKSEQDVTMPCIALYKNGDYLWSLPIADVVDASVQNNDDDI